MRKDPFWSTIVPLMWHILTHMLALLGGYCPVNRANRRRLQFNIGIPIARISYAEKYGLWVMLCAWWCILRMAFGGSYHPFSTQEVKYLMNSSHLWPLFSNSQKSWSMQTCSPCMIEKNPSPSCFHPYLLIPKKSAKQVVTGVFCFASICFSNALLFLFLSLGAAKLMGFWGLNSWRKTAFQNLSHCAHM